MKANLRPALVLQAFALLLLLAYLFSDAGRQLLDRVGDVKARYGYLYSALATSMFGGLIPFLVLLASGKIRRGLRGPELLFYVTFWFVKGVEVDALYRGQAVLFGDQNSVGTIVIKTLVDQLVYAPLWSAPVQVLFFTWKDTGFSIEGVRAAFRRQAFLERTLVVIFSTWVVWVPAVAIVYALPNALQVPLFNLVLCFWCLMISFISREA